MKSTAKRVHVGKETPQDTPKKAKTMEHLKRVNESDLLADSVRIGSRGFNTSPRVPQNAKRKNRKVRERAKRGQERPKSGHQKVGGDDCWSSGKDNDENDDNELEVGVGGMRWGEVRCGRRIRESVGGDWKKRKT